MDNIYMFLKEVGKDLFNIVCSFIFICLSSMLKGLHNMTKVTLLWIYYMDLLWIIDKNQPWFLFKK